MKKEEVIDETSSSGNPNHSEITIGSTTKSETLVSLGVYKQVARERDIAIQQLHELGYEFGQKIEPTTKNDLEVDCIDRDLLIKWLIEWDITPIIKNPLKRHIQGMPSVTPQEPKWIPVSERLPEENKTVIASTKYGVYPEARYTKEDGWEWAYESGADYWVELEYVTAWMPLPESYKEESEDQE